MEKGMILYRMNKEGRRLRLYGIMSMAQGMGKMKGKEMGELWR